MDVQTLLHLFLVSVIYPVWLIAGSIDYLCHRRTDIEATSGSRESWLHVAQFATLAVALLVAILFTVTPLAALVIFAALIAHTALSFIDVSYTQGRRHISTLEQHAHGFLDVLPLVAAATWCILHWNELQYSGWTLPRAADAPSVSEWWFLGSYLLLAGGPVAEELWRTHGFSRPDVDRRTPTSATAVSRQSNY